MNNVHSLGPFLHRTKCLDQSGLPTLTLVPPLPLLELLHMFYDCHCPVGVGLVTSLQGSQACESQPWQCEVKWGRLH